MALESYYLNGGFIGTTTTFGGTTTVDIAPTYVGTAQSSTNDTTNFNINLPAGTLPTDTIIIHIVYENSTTLRPTIPNFTILNSRNGTFSGTVTTQVLFQGSTSDSFITIPNNTTFGGAVASILVMRNVNSITASSLTDVAVATDAVFNRNLSTIESFAVMAALDGTTQNFTNWSVDSDWEFTDTHLGVPGRAGFVGVDVGPTSVSTAYSSGIPTPNSDTGTLIATIDFLGASTEIESSTGIWNLSAVLDSITVSPYRVTPSVTTVDESGLVTFDIVATGIADGTTLYWTTASSTDFVTNSGSFTITNEQGSFSVSPVSDITTEGPESFEVNIRTGSVAGPIVSTSETIFINDTSTTPRSFKTSLVDNSSVNTTAWTQQSVFDTTPTINNTGYTVTSSAITIPETGTYLCTFSCYFTSIVQRANIGVGFGINGVRQSEISGSNYIRALDGHNEATTSLTTIFELSAGDEVNLFFIGLALTGTVNLIGSASYITINKIA